MVDRTDYMRIYHRKKLGFEEPKIKDIKSLISNIKMYKVDFPNEEFNKQLDKLLENNPKIINEKMLKDILMWEVLDKKGLLSTQRIARILNTDSIWNKPLEDIMLERGYNCVEKDKERKYILSSI